MVLVLMSVWAWRVISPALPPSENDWMAWVALILPCWLVMVIFPASAASVLLLASEVIIPVVMLSRTLISISPAFPAAVLWAEIVLFGAVISPVLMVIRPPSPVPLVSVMI